ncbi:MAG: MATE family efflux transporter [Clostridia bacterium]|nr:MATE family efflux transporter [Clostridia bacterium]
MLKKFFGDRAFYRRVLAVALPIMIQNGITNFVSLLDNIMVGQVGTVQMNGVAVSNQLMFVFNLCVFGAVSGAGIFTAQYHGSGDHEGVRYTFRYKVIAAFALSAVGAVIFTVFGRELIDLFLQGEGDPAHAAASLEFGYEYLLIMLIGILPFALSNAYSSTLRETGQTVVPMVGGVSAVIVNLALNYVLIFGHFGAPRMGVAGAAVATVISRYVELAIVAVWTHTHGEKQPFIRGAFRSLRIPAQLFRRLIVKGSPLMVNEFLWSAGVAIMNQSYSTCGLDVVAAQNISSTLYNLSSVVYMALGGAVGIIIGQMLGRGESERDVRDADRKLITASVLSCVIFGGIMASVSGVFPMIYNTTDGVRTLAMQLICIGAFMMPFNAFTHASYFTIRSGGQTVITFLFDSCYMWAVCVPLAFCFSRFTDLPIIPLYCICQGAELVKCGVGAWLLSRGKWIRNLTSEK